MYPNGQASQPTGGQHSAFSHPPHLGSSSYYGAGGSGGGGSGGPGTSTPPYGQQPWNQSPGGAGGGSSVGFAPPYGVQVARHNSSSGQNWSPLQPPGALGADEFDEDDDDSEESEEEEEEEGEAAASSSNKKRKRSPAKGKGAAGASGGAAKEAGAAGGKKPKPTRGAKACTNCRRLKMRCVGAEQGPPCARCRHGNHDCIFEESNRGKKGGKNQRAEAMAQSLKKMEATLNTVLASLRDPAVAARAAGAMQQQPPQQPQQQQQQRRSPSPPQHHQQLQNIHPALQPASIEDFDRNFYRRNGAGAAAGSSQHAVNPRALLDAHGGSRNGDSSGTHPTASASGSTGAGSPPNASVPLGTRFVEPLPPTRSSARRAGSPRVHSLPDSTLNPLGLLAEASLHNHQRALRRMNSTSRRAASASVSSETPGSPDGRAKKEGEEAEETNGAETGASPSTAAAASLMGANNEAAALSRAYPSAPSEGSSAQPQSAASAATGAIGVASSTYFKPGPMTILPLRRIVIERELPPELLTSGVLTSEEVLELFQVFFHHCSAHFACLDPEWHTPTMICARSPFLFTAICTVAAKFYTKRPELYEICIEHAKRGAYQLMSRGWKSVEIVQGFMLLCLWNQPAERFEDDKTWLFSGVAIRMATDLNLHRKSPPCAPRQPGEEESAYLEREKELLNRERTWLMAFSIDRSLSGQMGKPWTIREDWIIRNSRQWCLQKNSLPWDLGISGMVELSRLTSRQLDFLHSSLTTVSGLNTEIDYTTILQVYNGQLEEWRNSWSERSPVAQTSEAAVQSMYQVAEGAQAQAFARWRDAQAPLGDDAEEVDHNRRTIHFMTKQAPLRYHYAVLILNSFGLQHAVDYPMRSGLDKGLYFTRCLQAAKGVIIAARDGLRPVLAYSPDPHFVIISYACVFLLKLTRPTFAGYANEEEIINLVTEGTQMLEEVAMSPTHTPALYASFLRTLLQTRHEAGTTRSSVTTPHRSRANSIDITGVDLTAAANAAAAARGSIEPRTRPASADPEGSAAAAFGAPLGGGNGGPSGFATPNMTAEQLAAMSGLDPNTFGGLSQSNMMRADYLNDEFWSQLMPPGFGGGPLEALSSGNVMMQFNAAPGASGSTPAASGAAAAGHTGGVTGLTPSQTRANTPSMLHSFTNVQFDMPSYPQ